MEYMSYSGIEVKDKAQGYARLEVKLDPHTLNVRGYVHGGLYFTLADSSAGVAAHSLGGHYVTLDANINFLKAAHEGSLVAHAKVIHQTNRIVLVDVETFNGDVLVTKASFTMYRLNELKFKNGHKEDKINQSV